MLFIADWVEIGKLKLRRKNRLTRNLPICLSETDSTNLEVSLFWTSSGNSRELKFQIKRDLIFKLLPKKNSIFCFVNKVHIISFFSQHIWFIKRFPRCWYGWNYIRTHSLDLGFFNWKSQRILGKGSVSSFERLKSTEHWKKELRKMPREAVSLDVSVPEVWGWPSRILISLINRFCRGEEKSSRPDFFRYSLAAA